MTMLATSFAADAVESFTATAPSFVLYWRFRPAHPWTMEQFQDRSQAYRRFFHLMERGIETRFEAN